MPCAEVNLAFLMHRYSILRQAFCVPDLRAIE